ncbi:MAG: glycosyltransferase family 1 protein [Pseudanabaenaceae cyanobacterium SKYGB_i_bin29]|nr:glycosyltransferase family 1 protein [Pseudanabaenaceae cyanobacterium SKYG29]MDW8420915.1 glycosyltransferase family 1 protein [Pseudanabaenaceae cyanobacterium SKYGB_i_bin29]
MLHFFLIPYLLREHSYEVYEYSNAEICKWAEFYLSRKTGFHLTNFLAGKVTENPNDILLGHPTFIDQPEKHPCGKVIRNWVKDNALTTDLLCHPNTYIFMPWVPVFPPEWTECMPFWQSQLLSARKIFGLCGRIWYDRTLELEDSSIQCQVKHKLVHINMGLAAQNIFPYKSMFNPIGQRGILHISHLGTYKGFDITCASLMGLDVLLHVAGNVPQLHEGLIKTHIQGEEFVFNFLGCIDNSDPFTNQWIIENYDFYIHTATMDAQATTILENVARGLIPLVTPESGFISDHAIYLTHDPDENRKIIRWALNLPESELLKRSQLLREQVLREHNWENIFNKVWDEISMDIEMRKQKQEGAKL